MNKRQKKKHRRRMAIRKWVREKSPFATFFRGDVGAATITFSAIRASGRVVCREVFKMPRPEDK